MVEKNTEVQIMLSYSDLNYKNNIVFYIKHLDLSNTF